MEHTHTSFYTVGGVTPPTYLYLTLSGVILMLNLISQHERSYKSPIMYLVPLTVKPHASFWAVLFSLPALFQHCLNASIYSPSRISISIFHVYYQAGL